MTLLPLAVIAVLMFTQSSNERHLAQAQSKARETFVSIDDIGSSVKIIGRLGIPLEEMATVRGVWEPTTGYENMRSPPPSKVSLRVTHVNQRALSSPAIFLDMDVDQYIESSDQQPYAPQEGAVWEFRACETARFAGMRASLPNEFRIQMIDVPGYMQQKPGTLDSQLLVVWRSIRGVNQPAAAKIKGE